VSDAARVGLCIDCRWMRDTTNRRGWTFFRCLRADTDARYKRYPPLPVLECPGHEPVTPDEPQDYLTNSPIP